MPCPSLVVQYSLARYVIVVQQHRQKAICESRPGHLWSSAWCFWVLLSCIDKKWILVDAWIRPVFPDPVTYADWKPAL